MSSLCIDINMDKPNRLYEEATLTEAIGKIKCGKMTCGKAAKIYHIPKATLQFNLKRGDVGFLRRGKLHANEEKSLAEYCRWMAQHNMPITYEILGRIVLCILPCVNSQCIAYESYRAGLGSITLINYNYCFNYQWSITNTITID